MKRGCPSKLLRDMRGYTNTVAKRMLPSVQILIALSVSFLCGFLCRSCAVSLKRISIAWGIVVGMLAGLLFGFAHGFLEVQQTSHAPFTSVFAVGYGSVVAVITAVVGGLVGAAAMVATRLSCCKERKSSERESLVSPAR